MKRAWSDNNRKSAIIKEDCGVVTENIHVRPPFPFNS